METRVHLKYSVTHLRIGVTNSGHMKITGLIPGTLYVIFVVPLHNFRNLFNGFLLVNTTASTGIPFHRLISVIFNVLLLFDLGFYFNGNLLLNNSVLQPSTIGRFTNGLICLTNSKNCCQDSVDIKGYQ